MVKKICHTFRVNTLEKRGVYIDAETPPVGFTDSADRLVKHAVLAYRCIMYFSIAIEMD